MTVALDLFAAPVAQPAPPPANRRRCFCGREPRGFQYQRPGDFKAPLWRLCSMAHLDTISITKGELDMAQITEIEAAAVMDASAEVGQYLTERGKTDMAAMSYEEWCEFLAHVFLTISAKVEARIPF